MSMAKLKETARRYGWRRACRRTVLTILARLGAGRLLEVLWLRRGDLAEASAEQAAGIEVRMLTEDDLAVCIADRRYDTEAAFVAQARRDGSVCLGAFTGGVLAAYAWFGRRNMELYPGLVVSVGDGIVYAYKGLTLPEFRERHCLTHILRMAFRLPVLPGTESMVSLVEASNLVSLTACGRIGFRRGGWLCLLGPPSARRQLYLGGGRRGDLPRITAAVGDSRQNQEGSAA